MSLKLFHATHGRTSKDSVLQKPSYFKSLPTSKYEAGCCWVCWCCPHWFAVHCCGFLVETGPQCLMNFHTFRATKGPEKSVLRKQQENKSPEISWDLDHTRRWSLRLRSQNKAGFVVLEHGCVSIVCSQHSLSKLLSEKPQNLVPELHTFTSPARTSSATFFSPDNQHSQLPGCPC